MSDEETFENYMKLSRSFSEILPACFTVANPKIPNMKIEIDNMGVKGNILFIFEGKRGEPNITQLKERFNIFEYNRQFFLAKGVISKYVQVRVFHYNLKRQRIIEFNKKGNIEHTLTYKNVAELIILLQKI